MDMHKLIKQSRIFENELFFNHDISLDGHVFSFFVFIVYPLVRAFQHDVHTH